MKLAANIFVAIRFSLIMTEALLYELIGLRGIYRWRVCIVSFLGGYQRAELKRIYNNNRQ